jgi:hypothetical protein
MPNNPDNRHPNMNVRNPKDEGQSARQGQQRQAQYDTERNNAKSSGNNVDNEQNRVSQRNRVSDKDADNPRSNKNN